MADVLSEQDLVEAIRLILKGLGRDPDDPSLVGKRLGAWFAIMDADENNATVTDAVAMQFTIPGKLTDG